MGKHVLDSETVEPSLKQIESQILLKKEGFV